MPHDGLSDIVREVGIDYITVTNRIAKSESGLDAFGSYLVQCETARGSKQNVYRASGYRGLHAGSVAFGRRQDGCCVRISGALAALHWEQAYNLSTNCTRLDVQVTVTPGCGVTQRLSNHHEELKVAKPRRGRPSSYKFWYGPEGPEAAILGKRSSDWFGRCYDKGLESGLPEYSGCLRYEAETKRDVANALCLRFCDSAQSELDMVQVVSEFVSVRGLRTDNWFQAFLNYLPDGHSRPLAFERQAGCGHLCCGKSCAIESQVDNFSKRKASQWLSICVRPSVQRLVAAGRLTEVLELLGLSNYVLPLAGPPSHTWSEFNSWR